MVEVLDALFPFLMLLDGLFFLVGVSLGIYLMIKGKTALFVLVVATLVVSNFCILALFFVVHGHARKELWAAAAETRAGKRELLIDGVKVHDPEPYLRAFEKMKWRAGRHSRTVPPIINVSFAGKHDIVRMRLERDSGRKHEYWVFFPKYKTTKEKEIGRVYTRLFAQ